MYYLYLFARFLVLNLSRKSAYALATLCSLVKFYLVKSDRDIIINNLIPVLKDKKQAYSAAKKVCENFGFYLVDFFRSSKIDSEFISKYVTVEGQDNLEKAFTDKKGAVLLSAHIGNYELGASIISLLKYPMYVLALSHKNKRVNNLFDYQRDIFGIKVIPTGQSVRRCLSVLRDGNFIAFLGDRAFGSAKTTEVNMFGRKAQLPDGPYFFALKTGSQVLPCFLIRENKYFYKFIFEKPIEYRDSAKDNIKEMIEKYAKMLESYILKYPEQWYMFEKCWVD